MQNKRENQRYRCFVVVVRCRTPNSAEPRRSGPRNHAASDRATRAESRGSLRRLRPARRCGRASPASDARTVRAGLRGAPTAVLTHRFDRMPAQRAARCANSRRRLARCAPPPLPPLPPPPRAPRGRQPPRSHRPAAYARVRTARRDSDVRADCGGSTVIAGQLQRMLDDADRLLRHGSLDEAARRHRRRVARIGARDVLV